MKLSRIWPVVLTIILAGCAKASHSVSTAPSTPTAAAPPMQAPVNEGPQLTNDQVAQALFSAINDFRGKQSLPPFILSPQLAQSAQQHSDAMERGSFLSTKGADEQPVYARISSAGVKTMKIGENVVRIKTRSDKLADETLKIWMSAPPDHKNLVSSAFTKTGIGVTRASDGTYYVAQDYAQ